MGKTIINPPFGNGLYHLFMVIWGMVYYCFTHIISPNYSHLHGKTIIYALGVSNLLPFTAELRSVHHSVVPGRLRKGKKQ